MPTTSKQDAHRNWSIKWGTVIGNSKTQEIDFLTDEEDSSDEFSDLL
jgi:hypothetical protein